MPKLQQRCRDAHKPFVGGGEGTGSGDEKLPKAAHCLATSGTFAAESWLKKNQPLSKKLLFCSNEEMRGQVKR